MIRTNQDVIYMKPCSNCPFNPKSLPYANPEIFRNIKTATFCKSHEQIQELCIPNDKKLGFKTSDFNPNTIPEVSFKCHKDKTKMCDGYLLTLIKDSIKWGYELPRHIKKIILEDNSSFSSFEEAEEHHSEELNPNCINRYDCASIPEREK